jgi:tetratricopeptide (TPR) repeat protein
LAREYFAKPVALIAGLTSALYWPFIYFEGDLLIVTFIITLDLTALLILVRALRANRAFSLAMAGLVFGLSAVARPSILIVLVFVPVAFWVNKPSWRPLLRRSLLLFGGALVAIAPVLVRNYVIGHDFVPIASQGGVNFYIGNNPKSDGRTAVVPGTRWDWWGGYQDAIRLAETEEGRTLRPSEVSNYYFAKGLRFVFGSPAESVPLMARKLALFWAGGERANNKYIYFFWHQSGMSKVPLPGFWLIAPLGLAGMVLLWRRRRGLALLYIFIITYMVGVVAFFVNARFRLPVVPVLIVFAAYAACRFVALLRSHGAGRLKTALLLALCFAVVDADFLHFRENKVYADSISHYTLGNAYLKEKRTDLAMREYEKALEVYRRYPTAGFRLVERNVKYNLGRLYAVHGDCARAVPLLEDVGGGDEYTILALELAGDCYTSLGRFTDAFRAYAQILRAGPGHPSVSSKLADAAIKQSQLYAQGGDRTSAVAILRQALAVVPGNAKLLQALESIEASP